MNHATTPQVLTFLGFDWRWQFPTHEDHEAKLAIIDVHRDRIDFGENPRRVLFVGTVAEVHAWIRCRVRS